MNLPYAGLTDIGCRRTENQDRWGVNAEQGLFIVADGVAGSSHGALAAQLAVDLLPDYVARHHQPPSGATAGEPAGPGDLGASLVRAVAELSDDLYRRGEDDPDVAGATTTVVAALVTGEHAVIAHLGDSRAFLFRDGSLDQLTTDHSLVQALIDAKTITAEQAAHHPLRNMIVNYVAMQPPATPDVTSVDLRDGDQILLCSDGLHGVVPLPALSAILSDRPEGTEACAELIAAARAAGGPDNITAVLIGPVSLT